MGRGLRELDKAERVRIKQHLETLSEAELRDLILLLTEGKITMKDFYIKFLLANHDNETFKAFGRR